MTRDVRQGDDGGPVAEAPELVSFEGADAAAVEALLRAFLVLAKALPEEADAALPLEWCGCADERTAALSRLLEPLAGHLVWRATGRRSKSGSEGREQGWATRLLRLADPDDRPSDEDVEAVTAEVEELSAALAGELGVPAPATISVSKGQRASDVAGELVRERGLEAGLDLFLVRHPDGAPGVAWTPIAAHRALVWSMGRLFDRIESMLHGDWILGAERHAATWYFSRWSGTKGGAAAFARDVREQEFALVDRPLVTCGATALELFIEDERFDDVPELQRQLADMLGRSVLGVFTVRDRRGENVVFEGGGSHRTYQVLEHSPEIDYDVGYVGLGRLIPYDGRYLRSPGMALLGMHDPGFADDLAASMIEAVADAPPPVLIEGVVAALAEGEKVPRSLPPAPSRSAAGDMFRDFTAALDELGLGTELTDENVPDDLADGDMAGYRQYRLDQTLVEWLSALGKQSRRPKRHPRRKRKRPRKRRRSRKRS
ncbi:MAG TPA: hypothetical protein VGD06_05390 [Acidobacteriota bacterium]